jgi:hypothetical protein
MNMLRIAPVDFTLGLTAREQLWPNPVVHFTNYPAEGMSYADKTKIDIAYLGGRPASVLQGNDVLFCAEREAPIHRDMVSYHNHLGISSFRYDDVIGIPSQGPLIPICSDTAKLSADEPQAVRNMLNGARIMLPVIVSSDTVGIARRFGLTSETTSGPVDIANNKKFLPALASLGGYLTPPTRKPADMLSAAKFFKELIDIAMADPARFEPKVWVKLCRSSGGEGVKGFTSVREFTDWLNVEGQGGDFRDAMVSDGYHEGIVLQLGVRARATDAAPNINFYVGDSADADRDLGASYQAIEDGSIHVGNDGMISESDREMISPIITRVSRSLRALGYRGLCGIDVIMGDNGEIWVIDINARWNASTSTLMLFNDLQRLPGVGVFRYTSKVRVPRSTSVSEYADWLDSQRIAFHPDRGGVVPINFMTAHRSPDKESYVGASIFARNHEAVNEYHELAHMN